MGKENVSWHSSQRCLEAGGRGRPLAPVLPFVGTVNTGGWDSGDDGSEDGEHPLVPSTLEKTGEQDWRKESGVKSWSVDNTIRWTLVDASV